MIKKIPFILFCLGLVVIFAQCSKQAKIDPNNSSSLDNYLYKQTQSLDNYIYMTDTIPATLSKSTDKATSSTNSPHSKFWKTRWNKFFYAQHDTAKGRTNVYKLGSTVKDSSIIILDDYVNSSDAQEKDILVMMKLSSNGNNKGGWIWAGFKRDGTVLFPSADKGSACYGCHKSASSNDYLLEF